MSPIPYRYFGIELQFYSNEHRPIHVHALYGEYEMRVIFYIMADGSIQVEYKREKGASPFPPAQMRDLKALIEKYKATIIVRFLDWEDRKNGKIKTVNITRKIR